MEQVKMDDRDEQLRAELLEAILEYLEGMRTFRSILAVGVTAHSRSISPSNPNLAKVVSQLNFMGNQVGNGKIFSKEEIKDTFTTMLEKLTKDIGAVFVYRLDRLSRQTADYLAIRKRLAGYNISIISTSEPTGNSPTEKLLETVLASFAQHDNDVRSEQKMV